MTLSESMRTWLLGCPTIAGLNVDWLAPESGGFSLDSTPSNPVDKQYLDGSSIRHQDFVLASRNYYGELTTEQLSNLEDMENIQGWIEKQIRLRNYPALDTGKTPRKVEVTTSGYRYSREEETARYQMQLRLTYYQQGAR